MLFQQHLTHTILLMHDHAIEYRWPSFAILVQPQRIGVLVLLCKIGLKYSSVQRRKMAKEAEGLSQSNGSSLQGPTTQQLRTSDSSQPVKVVVTGGLGFVGSAIVRALQEFHPDWNVWILDKNKDDREEEEAAVDDEFNLLRGCKYNYVQADITEGKSITKALGEIQPDAVIHTAGIVPSLSERYVRSQ